METVPVYVAARRLRVLVCQHQCGARRSGARSAERVFPRRSHLRHQHSRRSGHALRSSGAHCYCWAPRVTQLCTRARSARARARAPSPRAEAVVTRRPTSAVICAQKHVCPPRLTASHRARVSPDGAKTVPVGSNTACACEKRAAIPSGAPRSSARRRRPESLWEARGEGRRRLRPADLRGDVAAPGTHFRVFSHSGVRLLTKGSYSRSEAICNFIGRIDDPTGTVKCTPTPKQLKRVAGLQRSPEAQSARRTRPRPRRTHPDASPYSGPLQPSTVRIGARTLQERRLRCCKAAVPLAADGASRASARTPRGRRRPSAPPGTSRALQATGRRVRAL